MAASAKPNNRLAEGLAPFAANVPLSKAKASKKEARTPSWISAILTIQNGLSAANRPAKSPTNALSNRSRASSI
jgi:hypothetical protein